MDILHLATPCRNVPITFTLDLEFNECNIEAPLMKAPSTRRSTQRGHAEGLVPLMTLLVYGFVGLLLVVFIASLLTPIAWLKGKWRLAVVTCVLVFWGHLYWDNIQRPKDLTKWRQAARAQCDIEQAKLPLSIAVDGFLDEGAAMRKDSLLKLFSERRLKFIEVKVRPSPEVAARVAYPDGDHEGVWAVPDVNTPYVRLELGEKGDPACTALPVGVSSRADRAPFLPDTCITLKPLALPTARYSLTLHPSTAPEPTEYGSWTFINRETGEKLAKLTTVDTLNSIGSGQVSPRDAQTPYSDCRSPHTVIVDRLTNFTGKNDGEHPTQLLEVELVKPNADVASIDASAADVPLLKPVIEQTLYTEQESRELFSPEIGKPEWESSVGRARERGIASYGSRLIVWPERKLVSLTPTAKTNAYPWQVFAVDNGFIVLRTSLSWYETPHNLVARYSRDGSLEWTIRIASQAGGSTKCSHFWPQAVYSTETHLVFADRCGTVSRDQMTEPQKTTHGEVWKVALNSLPGSLSTSGVRPLAGAPHVKR
ncbi:hypothetical protein [Caenimonas aquaedulcis]|uniref:Uncharacterized protein n=1 Tax=Caenimonas aquaedulcis TaxID=2793270 RepID=A0A931MGM1_9BURK|nr:hypothetical protein [Caenimonas aquaedulcis]MBG9387425.1 hypothetical protein [Caenimonas aquaedulcis]